MRKFVVTALSLAVMMGTSVQMGYCGILDGNRYDEDTTISQIYEKMSPAIVLIEAEAF